MHSLQVFGNIPITNSIYWPSLENLSYYFITKKNFEIDTLFTFFIDI